MCKELFHLLKLHWYDHFKQRVSLRQPVCLLLHFFSPFTYASKTLRSRCVPEMFCLKSHLSFRQNWTGSVVAKAGGMLKDNGCSVDAASGSVLSSCPTRVSCWWGVSVVCALSKWLLDVCIIASKGLCHLLEHTLNMTWTCKHSRQCSPFVCMWQEQNEEFRSPLVLQCVYAIKI